MGATRFRIYRFDPSKDTAPRYEQYKLDVEKGMTVLDCLNEIKGYQDGTLTYRQSCRSAICGSCAMKINGHSKLACKTQALDITDGSAEILIEPLTNLGVLKDLVVDMEKFWAMISRARPWLEAGDEVPERERLQSIEEFERVKNSSTCIMCAACVSDCTSLEVDPEFIGPAALAKGFRFAADSREIMSKGRLNKLSSAAAMWDCARCYECVEVCPKEVKPLEPIMSLRQMAISEGKANIRGARHVKSFTRSVAHSGRLNEAKIPLSTVGMDFGALMAMAPVGLKMALKGKMPFVHKAIKEVEQVRKIHSKVEGHK